MSYLFFQNHGRQLSAASADKIKFFLEFVCEDSFGVACPSGVDKDLWSRFQAFEKWNATH